MQPAIIEPGRPVNVIQAAFRDLGHAKNKLRVAERLRDTIAKAVKETFMDAAQLPTDSSALPTKSPFNGRIDVSIRRMIESGYLSSCFEDPAV